MSRDVIMTFNPWVPNSYFLPKSWAQTAFLGWFQAFFLKSTGAKRQVLKLMGAMVPVVPVLMTPLMRVSSLNVGFSCFWVRSSHASSQSNVMDKELQSITDWPQKLSTQCCDVFLDKFSFYHPCPKCSDAFFLFSFQTIDALIEKERGMHYITEKIALQW